MTERTRNIIFACKGKFYPEIANPIDRVKTYMSEECACPIEEYTDDVIESILFEAIYDYIDVCDRPSIFIRQIRECVNKDLNLLERICVAFYMIQVRKNGKCINGFKEEWL